MSGKYRAVGWNRQKKIYDSTLGATVAAVALAFVGATMLLRPGYPIETFILRTTSLCAFSLLHVILCIGPLARLDARFLPLLYNRRHLGVTMFLLALVHAAFATGYYHGQGVVNPFVSVFASYKTDYRALVGATAISNLPFEPFGALALVILFLMAATSHDFWLRVLGASVWKTLHIGVYLAYGAVVAHVSLGVLQSEPNPVLAIILACGLALVLGLHLAAQVKEAKVDRRSEELLAEGFAPACRATDLSEGRGKVVRIGDERRAIYLYNGRVFALSNVCRHQGGPVGEGRILDGCVTCPWHGWQYLPDTGISPPPFHEVLDTYPVRVKDGVVYVNPAPNPAEYRSEGVPIAGKPAN